MRLKFLFVVGIGIGYVLGARAGRPRYEKLKARATDVWEDPRVQKVRAETQEFVKENAPIVQEKIVAGTKAAVAGAQEVAAKAAEAAKDASGGIGETAKDVSGKVAETARDVSGRVVKTAKDVSGNVARTAKDASENVAKTAKDVRERLTDRGEEVVDGVIIAAATARERALESDDEDEKPRATGRQGPPARRR